MKSDKTNQNEDWKTLISQLKKVAENQKITHLQIANKCGLHRSNVTRIFSLKICPSLENYLKVKNAIENLKKFNYVKK